MSSLGDVGAGNTLGRYELLTPIAQGGMALVWAARLRGTRGFQKIVAIKTMLPSLSDDPQFEQMFLAEAELASRIRHPNVCEILDLGEEDATLYIVMEWVNGEPLTALLRAAHAQGSIPGSVCARLVRDAALGLHAAHEVKNDEGELVGLVHRDVSPHNILVGHDGNVKIVDFGIAKATTAADANRTQAGQLKGKVPYMAPEQPRCFAVDRRTDVFALGIVLYQLVTAQHPFRASEEIETLKRLCDRTPLPRASSVAPHVSKQLDDAIAKALDKDPAQRFQTMADFATALDRALAELAAKGDSVEPSTFMKSVLGERAEKRRRTIKESIRVADARSKDHAHGAGELGGAAEDAISSLSSAPSGASLVTPSASSFGSGVSHGSLRIPTATDPTGVPPSAAGSDMGSSHAGVATDAPPPASTPRRRGVAIAIGTLVAIGAAVVVGAVALDRRPWSTPSAAVATSGPVVTTAPEMAATPTTSPSMVTTQATTAEAESIGAIPATASASSRPASLPKTGPKAWSTGASPRPSPTVAPSPPAATGDGLPRVRDPGF